MSAQIVEIAGETMVVLPVADYERLLDLAEDKSDFLAAVEAERRRDEGEEYLPSAVVDRILTGEGALRVWREYRGLSLAQLSASAGIGVTYLSDIERGLRRGSGPLWGKLARALNVNVEDILPAS